MNIDFEAFGLPKPKFARRNKPNVLKHADNPILSLFPSRADVNKSPSGLTTFKSHLTQSTSCIPAHEPHFNGIITHVTTRDPGITPISIKPPRVKRVNTTPARQPVDGNTSFALVVYKGIHCRRTEAERLWADWLTLPYWRGKGDKPSLRRPKTVDYGSERGDIRRSYRL